MEDKHQIGEIMGVTMEKIKEMIDVNTIIGEPIRTPDGITIIPVSKVSVGFASGGSDFVPKNLSGNRTPFGGGSGAGVNIMPVAFLVVNKDRVRLLPVEPPAAGVAERVVEMVPELVDRVTDFIDKKKEEKPADTDEEVF
ncbi:MAG: GerW family sporulation protein [Oscillospiraceae bacterium]|nr:GerW family sporulation protein [Oscillospiraceae bacterium]